MSHLVRQEVATAADTLVVKVGSRVLTQANGSLDEQRIGDLAEQLAQLVEQGRRVVLVSSGAVAAGIDRLGLGCRPRDLARLQAASAAGQSRLVEAYERALSKHNQHAAQVLLTADDLNHRTRYLNLRNTLTALFECGVLPIVNENDCVSVEELQLGFGDNDRLAAMVTNLLQAPLLVMLSDVEGLYDRDPSDPNRQRIGLVDRWDDQIISLAQDRLTSVGTGGMASKLEAARIATAAGETVIIASGHRPRVLLEIMQGEDIGTLFLPQGQSVRSRKRWIGFAARPKGKIAVDQGAHTAITQQGRSLLAAGIVSVDGEFTKGDLVTLLGPDQTPFARGLSNYTAAEVRQIQGLQTDRIPAVLGHCPYDEVIHRDNLALA